MDRSGPWDEQWVRGEGEAAADVTPSTGAIALAAEETVVALGLPLPKVTIATDDGVIGVLLRRHDAGFLTLSVGLGEVRGELTILLPLASEGVRFVFESNEARGSWEPLYRFFAELASRLGAVPQGTTESRYTLDVAALRETLAASLDACASDCLFAEGLATYAFDLHIEPLEPRGVVSVPGEGHGRTLRVARGSEAIGVELIAPGVQVHATLGGDSVLLSDSGLEVLEAALRADWATATEPVRRAFRLRTAPPAATDFQHHGATVAFAVRDDGSRKQLDPRFAASVSTFLQEHLAATQVEVIRYFQDGTPFWRAAFERNSRLPSLKEDKSLDELFAHRTWQWRPGDAASLTPPPPPNGAHISLRLA